MGKEWKRTISGTNHPQLRPIVDYELGCCLPTEEWIHLNGTAIFQEPGLLKYVSRFPPPALMRDVSGLTNEADCASHGAEFFRVLSESSAKPLTEYRSILDFGCGCGRLARMFKGHPHRVCDSDVDHRHVAWMKENLSYMDVRLNSVRPPIPYADEEFEAIFGISVFTHLNERTQDQFLEELRRVCARDGRLFLRSHVKRALARAMQGPAILNVLSVSATALQESNATFCDGRLAFILQEGHLTSRRPKGAVVPPVTASSLSRTSTGYPLFLKVT
ncbi:MAG: class I SAM-dependent methyltransferase [Planctomycetes bacterium]|nr:class I SAM-dependent methyltransferase [Planctomycetota bacterium]